MFEYEVLNETTGERSFMWGGSVEDARHKNPEYNDWAIIFCERIAE